MQPPSINKFDSEDSLHLIRELDSDLGLRDACLKSWDGLDTELPVIHALADGERVAGSDVVEVKLSDGFLGIIWVPVADVTVGPVDSAELNHQPKLKNPPAGGEYGDELVLEAISWDPVAVHLSALYTCTVLYILYNAAARASRAAGEF